MRGRDAETDRGAIVHDVERITIDAELLGQLADEFGIVIEGVGEAGAIRRIAMAEIPDSPGRRCGSDRTARG